MENAYEMAVDCLGLGLTSRKEEGIDIPQPTPASNIKINSNEYLVIVEFDMIAYQKKHNAKSIKKTLTIPEWLNEEALALNINFSQVLQDALLQKIKQ